jgi:hypothetical protein
VSSFFGILRLDGQPVEERFLESNSDFRRRKRD